VAAEAYFPPDGPDLDLTIAGVVRDVDDAVDRDEGTIYATPALYETVRERVDEFATYLTVMLEPGATSDDFEQELSGVAGDRRIDLFTHDVRSKPARTTVSALAVALTGFATAAAVAALVVVGQAIARHLAGSRRDLVTLRAIGISPRALQHALVWTVLPVAFGGAVAAGLLAALASTTMPIGLARRIEPDRGIDLDAWVLTWGPLLIAVAVLGLAVVGAWFARRPEAAPAARPSIAIAATTRSGASPALVNGMSLAIDRRTESTTARSAIAGAVIAVVVAVGVLVFAGSLHRLVDSPERWGFGWDLTFDLTSDTVDDASRAIAADDQIVEVARFDSGATIVGGSSVRANGLTSVEGRIGFALLDGRQPEGPGEAVIGPATAAHVGLGIGDAISVVRPESDAPPGSLEIVGIALFPEVDEGDFTDGVGMVDDDFEAYATVPAAFEASQVVARVAEGEDPEVVAARLGAEYEQSPSGLLPVPPSDIETVSSVRVIPRWLLAFVALLGIAAVAHGLQTTVSRRRTHLTVLRVLGMTRRQIRQC
jgi:hypothetical protein